MQETLNHDECFAGPMLSYTIQMFRFCADPLKWLLCFILLSMALVDMFPTFFYGVPSSLTDRTPEPAPEEGGAAYLRLTVLESCEALQEFERTGQ